MKLFGSLVYWKDINGIYLGYYQFGQINTDTPLDEQSILGKTDYDLFSKEIADIHRQQDIKVIQENQEMVFDDPSVISMMKRSIIKKPMYDAQGNISGIIANVLPAENQAIKQVVESAIGLKFNKELTNLEYVKYLKSFYENFITTLSAHVYWVDVNNIYLGSNESHTRYLGFKSAEEIIGKSNAEILLLKNETRQQTVDEDFEEVLLQHAKTIDDLNKTIMQSGQTYVLEEFAQQPERTDIFYTQKAPLKDLEGNVIGLLGISFNITEAKRNEERRLSLMLEASHTGTWTWNFKDNTFIHDQINHQGPYRLASSISEFIARAHPADQEILQQALQNARDQKSTLDLEYRLTWIDGSPRHFAMRGKVVEDKTGQSYCMVGICWDITERKHQEELRQKQQVAIAQVSRQNAMGELASTLAHELNQPLAAISNYIDGCIIRLQNGQSQTSDLLRAMQLASVQSTRAGEIIHRIKNFMRRGELIFSATEINHIISEIITTMQFELTSNQVKLKLKLSNNLPKLQLDEIQIGQVVLNLLRNAVEAMQGNNTEAPEITIKTTQQNKQVLIDVIDNGPGCPEEIANQLFTAYFTTKKNGMGIGLAICRSIVEAHAGQLVIMPYKNGAWFRFSLPIGNAVIDAKN